MSTPLRLRTIQELDGFLAQSGELPRLLFKHSTRCPISTRAHGEFLEFLDQAPTTLAAIVYVVEERTLSTEIAGRLGVTHESPQCFLIASGKVLWHDSHERVTSSRLAQEVAAAAA